MRLPLDSGPIHACWLKSGRVALGEARALAGPSAHEEACADRHADRARAGGLYIHSGHHPESRAYRVPGAHIAAYFTTYVASCTDRAADTNAATDPTADGHPHTGADRQPDSGADRHAHGRAHARRWLDGA